MSIDTVNGLNSSPNFRSDAPPLLVPPPLALAAHKAGLEALPPPAESKKLEDIPHQIKKLEVEKEEIELVRNRGTHSPILIAIAVAGLAVALFSLLLVPISPLPFLIVFSVAICVYAITSNYVVIMRDSPLAGRQAQIDEEIAELRKKAYSKKDEKTEP